MRSSSVIAFTQKLWYTLLQKHRVESGGTFMMDRERMAMKNAEASVRMEGYRITPKMREQCQRVLSGKITVSQLLKQYKQKRENV